jgi:hypothetical protein
VASSLHPDSVAGGTVRLEIPAAPRYLSAARLVAASLGAEAGLSVDDLEDLRLGVDELLATLIEAGRGGAVVRLGFVQDGRSVLVEGELIGDAAPVTADEMTRRIAAAVADHYELGPSSFRLQKSASA